MKKSVCMKGNDPLIHTDYRIGFFPHSFRRKMKSNNFDRIVQTVDKALLLQGFAIVGTAFLI